MTAVPLLEADRRPRLPRPRPRPELRRATGGDDEALPRPRLRVPGPRGLDHHPGRRAAVLAGLEQRAAQAHPGREAATRVPALPEGRPRPRRAPRLGAGGGRPGRPVDAAAAQEHPEPAPPRRARGDRGEPRALHPRAHGGRRGGPRPPGERPRDRARAGHAGLLGSVGRARERLRRPRDLGPEGPAAGPARRGVLRPAAAVALARGGEGLLLRLLQRGPLAPVPHRPHPAALPERGLAPVPGGQPQVRRGRVRGGGLRRSHRPRPGLPLRAPARG